MPRPPIRINYYVAILSPCSSKRFRHRRLGPPGDGADHHSTPRCGAILVTALQLSVLRILRERPSPSRWRRCARRW